MFDVLPVFRENLEIKNGIVFVQIHPRANIGITFSQQRCDNGLQTDGLETHGTGDRRIFWIRVNNFRLNDWAEPTVGQRGRLGNSVWVSAFGGQKLARSNLNKSYGMAKRHHKPEFSDFHKLITPPDCLLLPFLYNWLSGGIFEKVVEIVEGPFDSKFRERTERRELQLVNDNWLWRSEEHTSE